MLHSPEMFWSLLVVLALLSALAGFLWAQAARVSTTTPPPVFEGDTLMRALDTVTTTELAGCKRQTGNIRCDFRWYFYEMGRGHRWMGAYPTVAALDRAVMFAGDSLLTSAPEHATPTQWMRAIQKLEDSISMAYDATKESPTLAKLEAFAADAWTEGCAPR